MFTSAASARFSHGYHQFHPDIIMNFQMNRWITYLGAPGIADMRAIAPRIHTFADWKREFLAVAQAAEAAGHLRLAAYHYRSADFFAMGDPDRPAMRRRFLELIRQSEGITEQHLRRVPYAGGYLPVVSLKAEQPRDTVVIHGGFDSYVEEFLPCMVYLRDRGYNVVGFEGPGQGTPLYEYSLPMTPDWHRPLAAVLDDLGLENVTLVGISLGGLLVTRAAAFEPRVQRYVAWNGLVNLFDHIVRHARPAQAAMLRTMLRAGLSAPVNAMMRRRMEREPFTDWSVRQGMQTFAVESPFEFYRECQRYDTRAVSNRVVQDVLLLGSDWDSLGQFYTQQQLLVNARSVTTRRFTLTEGGQYHCSVGATDMVIDAVEQWLDHILAHPGRPTATPGAVPPAPFRG